MVNASIQIVNKGAHYIREIATIALIREHFEVEIAEIDFIVELSSLEGRSKLPDLPVYSLITC